MSDEVIVDAVGFAAYVTKPEALPGGKVLGQPGLAVTTHDGDAVLITRHHDGSMMSVQLDEERIEALCHALAAIVERGNAELRRRSLQ